MADRAGGTQAIVLDSIPKTHSSKERSPARKAGESGEHLEAAVGGSTLIPPALAPIFHENG
jgi:hypothetical protein